MSSLEAQNQPIERVWSPSYSVEAKSIMGNKSGWWITAREQLFEDFRYRPVLLHWQPSADSFVIHRLWDDFTPIDDGNLSGNVSSLQKLPDGRIAASANYDLACDAIIGNPLTNKGFVSSDSSTTLWQLNDLTLFKESYTFPSDTALVFADSIYIVSPTGQPVITRGHSYYQSLRHVPYQQDKVGIITDKGISLYNQQGTKLHQNTIFDSLHATHWLGDTIAATEGDTLVYYNNSLQIIAQKDLSPHFSSAPVVTTWQDRLLLAGLNPQETEWHVKAMTMNQQISTLVTFGDSTWALKDMHVNDSVLGLTGVQYKDNNNNFVKNSNALLFKTIHLPDTVKEHSIDVALTDMYVDSVNFDKISGGTFDGLYDVKYDLYGQVRNNSTKDTIHRLGMYLGFDSPSLCPSFCFQTNFYQLHDSLQLLPGESKTLIIYDINDRCQSDSINIKICPVVIAPNRAIDPDMSNNSTCDTLTAVGVETPSPSSANIRIYPTYVREQLIVETEASFQKASITIHDIGGRKIYRSKMNGNRQTIELNAQPTGVYVATVSTSQGTYSRKFVIGE